MQTELITAPRTGASFARGQSKQDYQTPQDFMAAVRKRFGVPYIDLAATEENRKAKLWYGPGSTREDSLAVDWTIHAGNLCWLNPPFGDIAPWARKCDETWWRNSQSRILFLTPASVGACWFRDSVWNDAMVLALNPRLCFDGKNPFPKDCMLSCWGFELSFKVWTWK